MPEVYQSVAELPRGFHVSQCRPQPFPDRVLVCRPDHFDVKEVRNPFMQGQQGKVDRDLAKRQWEALCSHFRRAGLSPEELSPLSGCEDMVFTANPTFTGLDANGRRVCVLSRMKHAGRQAEVPSHALWYRRQGHAVETPAGIQSFEGGGDSIWHPGRAMVWGGVGDRTGGDAYPWLSQRLGVPVLTLKVVKAPFYHLDTCFAALDEKTALVHSPALAPESAELVRSQFARVIEAPEREAVGGLACNATASRGKTVVLPSGNPETSAALRAAGFDVIEAETSEFQKSGGSVYCMKAYVF